MRPEALVEMRSSFELLETTLLADGREWILKTEGPSLADIEGTSLYSTSIKLSSCTVTNDWTRCLAISLAFDPARRSSTRIYLSADLPESLCLD